MLMILSLSSVFPIRLVVGCLSRFEPPHRSSEATQSNHHCGLHVYCGLHVVHIPCNRLRSVRRLSDLAHNRLRMDEHCDHPPVWWTTDHDIRPWYPAVKLSGPLCVFFAICEILEEAFSYMHTATRIFIVFDIGQLKHNGVVFACAGM